jgi:hypothetical protein
MECRSIGEIQSKYSLDALEIYSLMRFVDSVRMKLHAPVARKLIGFDGKLRFIFCALRS